MAAISAATTASEILHQTNTFISEILAQPDLRHSIYSTLRNKIPPSNNQTRLKPLNLAAETLENAISSTTNSSIQSSSLRLAKKLLLSYPQNPFSSFLFSLIYHLCNQPVNASLSLLNIFSLDPSLARSEIAPVLFEELFLVHFVPILQRHNEQRSSILSSLSTQSGYDSDEYSVCDVSVVVPCTKLLSKMSGNQASELKELERNYEEVLDENCRVFFNYFKDVLENSNENGLVNPPSVVLRKLEEGGDHKLEQIIENETIKSEEGGWQNGRYNVMFYLFTYFY